MIWPRHRSSSRSSQSCGASARVSLDEVCAAAQEAIDDADALGYKVLIKAQALHDLGEQLIPTNPKRAFDKCKDGYRLATRNSTAFR